MKLFILSTWVFIISVSCRQHSSPAKTREHSEKVKDTTQTSGITVWVDTIYDKNQRIEEILRGENNGRKFLEGPSDSYYPNGILKTVKYFHNDTARGNFLEFYPNGRLHKFSYLINNEYAVYYREYDDTGKITVEKGNPYIDHHIIENNSRDTAHLIIFLSDYGFANLELYISPNGEEFGKMESSIRRNDGTKIFKMWKRTAGLNHISFYMKIIGMDSNGNEHIYRDTLSFMR